ncbi:TAF11 family protein [Abortiporus biennis]
MSSPFATYPVPERSFIPANPGARGSTSTFRGTGSKRGRKPKNLPDSQSSTNQSATLQWSTVQVAGGSSTSNAASPSAAGGPNSTFSSPNSPAIPHTARGSQEPQPSHISSEASGVVDIPSVVISPAVGPGDSTNAVGTPRATVGPGEEEGEGEDELLPAMADDDYSAQLSFQSQSKDNLKVLMDNFGAAQYDRFEAYRRHALPKQAVRKVIQTTLGQQVSQPVAQIVAGFGKVFVGEIIEQARAVQASRGESGPLAPDHLREAYRLYQQKHGRVGAARPLKGKRLFVR